MTPDSRPKPFGRTMLVTPLPIERMCVGPVSRNVLLTPDMFPFRANIEMLFEGRGAMGTGIAVVAPNVISVSFGQALPGIDENAVCPFPLLKSFFRRV